jgi:hypothetical protein
VIITHLKALKLFSLILVPALAAAAAISARHSSVRMHAHPALAQT